MEKTTPFLYRGGVFYFRPLLRSESKKTEYHRRKLSKMTKGSLSKEVQQ